MQVFLIRHPQPLIDLGICYGRLDVDCVDPHPVAAQIRPQLPEGTPVFSSPLQRARRLAEAIHHEVEFDARLAEIHFGEWEGQPWDSIDRALLDAWANDILRFTPPGGEPVARLQARVVDFVSSLRERNLPRVALVTHAGVIRTLLAHFRQLSYPEWTKLKIDFGSVTLLEIEPSV
ncbi:alpha-ribazole phosphatase family protein [Propionivibrio limicola]|uniref:alpha-ribazole phosphatase family protein n=1 Tax=Propionivibrio limicola TaxID=167645 RepID=UPI001479365F|nr:alpha-ribazole phosphatase family protein [Propionivibrio limicola]